MGNVNVKKKEKKQANITGFQEVMKQLVLRVY